MHEIGAKKLYGNRNIVHGRCLKKAQVVLKYYGKNLQITAAWIIILLIDFLLYQTFYIKCSWQKITKILSIYFYFSFHLPLNLAFFLFRAALFFTKGTYN